ncbi:tRNA uridine-5-carboxymethylaminomethyl(34) synthesis GTPase MnmE [Gottschalkiaceae bacterium SANA]|nr:tRNA uridine-5-carboxymethylaminomethyl(34) synthesis GTPase MnmE [Gottschalkiaceae bacterium SANA]
MKESTIAAIATAPGEAGVGIVRISGEESLRILTQLFFPQRGEKIASKDNRRMIFGQVKDPKSLELVDEALAVYMVAPQTYTREDVVEIQCHGGLVAVKKILTLCLQAGAELAGPGEFTKRAFLNGRFDLAQAEAVMELISAKTNASYQNSLKQLSGNLSEQVLGIRRNLLEVLASITVATDFPENEDEAITVQRMKGFLVSAQLEVERLLETAETGRILRDGVKTVILGKPNVGKSSLMNALLRENRAIVTEVAGTTRDSLEEYVNLHGVPLRLIDTAGIRETNDQVEKIGVDRAVDWVGRADLLVAVFDKSSQLEEEDHRVLALLSERKAIILLNKSDLEECISREIMAKEVPNAMIIETSMATQQGLETFENAIKDLFFHGGIDLHHETVISNVRHKNLLQKTLDSMQEAIQAIEAGMPVDCFEVDVKDAWQSLGEISGDAVTEDVLDQVFQEFCIGK